MVLRFILNTEKTGLAGRLKVRVKEKEEYRIILGYEEHTRDVRSLL